MKSIYFQFITLSILFSMIYSQNQTAHEEYLLDYDWQFRFDKEEKWRNIDIPHDYSIIQKFDERLEGEAGFLPGGTVYYKKTFTIKRQGDFFASLYFQGVYKEAYVTLNGVKVGENHYGYNPFSFDVTKQLKVDGETENVLEVKVEHAQPSSRWYSGSGIFRSVKLTLAYDVHFAVDGVYVTTPDIEKGEGKVKVASEVVNNAPIDKKICLHILIKDKEGNEVAKSITENEELKVGETRIINDELIVEKPELWSDKTPNLYTIEVELYVNDDFFCDSYSSRFGFRYFHFDKKVGFTLNGVPTKLHGFCNHHDNGALGSIDNYDADYRKFKQLKELGFNSVRTSHNVPHRTWIDICEELGILVDEEFFDGWNYSKNGNNKDFSEFFHTKISGDNHLLGSKDGMVWSEYAIKAAIKRDRNSPSVIMWSIGNEIDSNSRVDGNSRNVAKNLILWGKEMDDTRPYTSGENDAFRTHDPNKLAINDEIAKSGGVVGYNYGNHGELKDGAEKYGAIYISESASVLNSRGVYSVYENSARTQGNDGLLHITSYDISFPFWGTTTHYCLWITLTQDFCAGQYIWTAHDYIGEPTPWSIGGTGSVSKKGPVPNSSYFGIIDTAGFPKDTYYLYSAQLRKDIHTLHIVSAWDKNNIYFYQNTKKTPVHVYTSVPKAYLYRSDKEEPICGITREVQKTEAGHIYYTFKVQSLDKMCEAVNPDRNDVGTDLYARFNIEFMEGTKIYAKGFNEEEKEIEKSEIIGKQTAGQPNLEKMVMEVKCDKEVLKPDSKNLAYITVEFKDEEGYENTKGNYLVSFTLEGEGKILGVDNGDSATVDKFQEESVLKGPDFAVIKAYSGKALCIVTSNRKEGNITVTVSSENFEDQKIEIKVE